MTDDDLATKINSALDGQRISDAAQGMRMFWKELRVEALVMRGMTEKDAWEQANNEWVELWYKISIDMISGIMKS